MRPRSTLPHPRARSHLLLPSLPPRQRWRSAACGPARRDPAPPRYPTAWSASIRPAPSGWCSTRPSKRMPGQRSAASEASSHSCRTPWCQYVAIATCAESPCRRLRDRQQLRRLASSSRHSAAPPRTRIPYSRKQDARAPCSSACAAQPSAAHLRAAPRAPAAAAPITPAPPHTSPVLRCKRVRTRRPFRRSLHAHARSAALPTSTQITCALTPYLILTPLPSSGVSTLRAPGGPHGLLQRRRARSLGRS